MSTELLNSRTAPLRANKFKESVHFVIGECTLGSILVGTTSKGICAIFLGDCSDTLADNFRARYPGAQLAEANEASRQLIAAVIRFIETPGETLDIPLDIRGTDFQQRVWQALCDIPLGCTTSYTDLAQSIGAPKAIRAVANACASNTIAIAIPCHRVVRNNGALSGYRWGSERKRMLLNSEATAYN